MLSVVEGRVLGCLLEKERTVPDQYPLTLNSLVLACNQSTARDPVMRLADHEVEGALASLKAQGLLRYVHPSHGRSVTRYRQVADEAWGLAPKAAALLAVLLVRGPQTAAELRTRAERLHDFSSLDVVERELRALVADGRAHLLDRHPGQKEARWQQLVADEPDIAPPAFEPGRAPSGGPSTADRLAALEARVARLEAALADLIPDDDAP